MSSQKSNSATFRKDSLSPEKLKLSCLKSDKIDRAMIMQKMKMSSWDWQDLQEFNVRKSGLTYLNKLWKKNSLLVNSNEAIAEVDEESAYLSAKRPKEATDEDSSKSVSDDND
jgi:hypothetical protein